jgi:glycosyltransferase involved in cell wall biosynthesis
MIHQRPFVTAILTTYNRKDWIRGAVESILDQTYPDIEIIIVDDCSDYDVKGHLYDYKTDIKLVRNDENRGANWSRATGISKAEGEYVAFLDDDDRWSPTKIEQQVRAIEESSSKYGVATTGFQRIDGSIQMPDFEDQHLTKQLLLGNNPIGGFSKILVEMSVIERAGLPDIHLSSSQDIEWFIRLSKESEFLSVSEPLVNFNEEGEDRITDKKKNKLSDSHGEILRKHSDLVEEYGVTFKRKAWNNRNIRISAYAAAINDFGKCREHSLKAIRLYPFNRTPYLLLILSLFGNRGYQLAKKATD